MTTRLRIIALILLTAFAARGFTQDSNDPPPFVIELGEMLRDQAWSDAEIDELVAATEALDWPMTTGVNVEVVSLALAYYRDREAAPFSSGEAALLASELADVATAMQESGFRPVEIGRATVEGTRDALSGRALREAPTDARMTGEALREEVLSRVRDQIRIVASDRGSKVARETMRRIDDLIGDSVSPGDVPQGPLGGPLD